MGEWEGLFGTVHQTLEYTCTPCSTHASVHRYGHCNCVHIFITHAWSWHYRFTVYIFMHVSMVIKQLFTMNLVNGLKVHPPHWITPYLSLVHTQLQFSTSVSKTVGQQVPLPLHPRPPLHKGHLLEVEHTGGGLRVERHTILTFYLTSCAHLSSSIQRSFSCTSMANTFSLQRESRLSPGLFTALKQPTPYMYMYMYMYMYKGKHTHVPVGYMFPLHTHTPPIQCMHSCISVSLLIINVHPMYCIHKTRTQNTHTHAQHTHTHTTHIP